MASRRFCGGGTWMIAFAAVVVVVLMTCVEAGGHSPVLHRVGGGSNGWREDVNFANWTAIEEAQMKFYVGDWLYFGFDKHRYNVLQVNKTSYETCNDKDFIANITRGGRDVFQLSVPGQYYFLSGGGYCYHGMKVAINVVNYIEAPAPAPAHSGSAPISNIWNSVPILMLIVSLVSAITYNGSLQQVETTVSY